MDGSDVEVDTLLYCYHLNHFSQQGLEVLSFISTLIIENEQNIQLFETGEEAQIHSYLAKNLKYLLMKI